MSSRGDAIAGGEPIDEIAGHSWRGALAGFPMIPGCCDLAIVGWEKIT